MTSLYHYKGAMKKAIHELKYRGVTDIVGELSELINLVLREEKFTLTQVFAGLGKNHIQVSSLTSYNYDKQQGRGRSQIVCIPIPLHGRKVRERGFNQAELIARLFAAYFNWPIRTDILVRTREAPSQVEVRKRTDRLANMHGVFAVKIGANLPPDTAVVLVDDVYTTGATLSAAASTLKRAGVSWVWAMTLAR